MIPVYNSSKFLMARGVFILSSEKFLNFCETSSKPLSKIDVCIWGSSATWWRVIRMRRAWKLHLSPALVFGLLAFRNPQKDQIMTTANLLTHKRLFNANRHLEFGGDGYWIFFSIWVILPHHKIRKQYALELWTYFYGWILFSLCPVFQFKINIFVSFYWKIMKCLDF